MGRGRAKAKQTKVARDLKYRSYSTDFASLERELRSDGTEVSVAMVNVVDEDADDEYDEYSDDDEADDDYRPTARAI
ncbi:MAG: DUF3073 domain-containing protein [Propionibacteriaceae bacterium]|nr:DUF3073 domain-containing protein [Micropruina sp.]HBX82204.1 DUF3073 domain-containing protein [Propionibacteriaceae bacterium]HBY22397.1 DUF3073 domain-containing protein [Propionibacteriaceae bacterium]